MKRIVICCDGTWNDPAKPRQTNVRKLHDAVINFAAGGVRQVPWYTKGVGTQGGFLTRLRDGAFGYGLGTNVREAYSQIVRVYEPGDQLFLFGFSRGAYTARSTLGMVRKCGILRPELIDQVPEAYAFYKSDLHPDATVAQEFRRAYSVRVAVPGETEEYVPRASLIGVWDTVGSLGIPVGRFRKAYEFHDVALTSWVERGYHALAIDEQRRDYVPTLWEQNPKVEGTQVIEQRWFAGVHSDVGGGAAIEGEDGQSDRCLPWIIDKARECGLEFDDAMLERTASTDDLGPLDLAPGLLFGVLNLIRGRRVRAVGAGVPVAMSVYEGLGLSHEAVDFAVLKRQETTPYVATNVDAYWARFPAAKDAARARL